MSIFDKLTARQLLVIFEILVESSLTQEEFIREKYSRSALNYEETIEFLIELGLVKVKDGIISSKSEHNTLLARLVNSEQKEQLLRNFVGRLLLERKASFSGEVEQFISYFKFENNRYEFKPNQAVQRLKYSGLRNFLMDLEVLHLDPNTSTYIINSDYIECLTKRIIERGLTPEEFAKKERRNKEIGLRAELRIIEYEKDRLASVPRLVEKIEHVAKYDVSLGYDIKSFEVTGDELGAVRLIEVKAVSIWDYGFNWTKNEIEASKINRNSYYLYLLPVVSESLFDLGNLKIIKDPFMNVLNSEQWSKTCELFSFRATPASN